MPAQTFRVLTHQELVRNRAVSASIHTVMWVMSFLCVGVPLSVRPPVDGSIGPIITVCLFFAGVIGVTFLIIGENWWYRYEQASADAIRYVTDLAHADSVVARFLEETCQTQGDITVRDVWHACDLKKIVAQETARQVRQNEYRSLCETVRSTKEGSLA